MCNLDFRHVLKLNNVDICGRTFISFMHVTVAVWLSVIFRLVFFSAPAAFAKGVF